MVTRCLVLLVALAGAARADSPKLAKARQAIDGVRYDEAQQLLVEALKEGNNSPAGVAEIYRLSASTAVVLERRDLAEQYYRRWLALDPAAALPDDLAPKIREPFVKAQAYMNAHGRLVAKVSRAAATVEVIVETDPLGMAYSATTGSSAIRLDANRRVTLEIAGPTAAVLDEYGNRLVELVVPQPGVVKTAIVPDPPPPTRVPFYRRGKPWLIASGVVVGGGVITGLLARRANSDAQFIVVTSDLHTFDDYTEARDRRDRYALIANGLFLVGGALAATAVIMYITEPLELRVTPAASGSSVGVTVTRTF